MSTPNSPAGKIHSLLIEEDPELRDVVEEFVTGLTQRLAELQAAHEQNDWDMLATLAHRLKGAGGSYGYPDMTKLGAEMETAFRQKQAERFNVFFQQFETLVRGAQAGLADSAPPKR